jgi:ComF family protein
LLLPFMFLTRIADPLYDALLTLAYPQACALCRKNVENRRFGAACIDCWASTEIFTGNETLCWKCGAIAPTFVAHVAADTVRCHRCDCQLFEAARACGFYEGALRESVLLLKRQPTLCDYLAELLIRVAQRPPLDCATRIVPVPLHAERERRRGFNQAVTIARAVGSKLRLVIDDVSLVRVGGSEKYRAGLDVKGRHDTVANAFAVRLPQLIADEKVLLIDDVFTTGATASSCTEALLKAGAKAVHVLTIARPR